MVSSFDRNTKIGSPSGTATSSSTIDNSEQFAVNALGKRSAGDYPAAIKEAQSALALSPASAHYWLIFGNLLVESLSTLEGVLPLSRALQIQPDSTSAVFNLANAWHALDSHDRAIALFSRALSLDPTYTAGYANMGSAYRELGEVTRAIRAYTQATYIRPDRPEPQWNLATALLLSGDFERGLPALEWRKRLPEHFHRSLRPNPWRAGANIAGKTVLVYEEQGIGDLIQFARFLPEVRKRGARSVLVCSPRIAPLMLESNLADAVATESEAQSEAFATGTVTTDIMSLPFLLGVSTLQLPVRESYLRVSPYRRENWRWVRRSNAINVGIAWQGKPSPIDRGRSFPVTHFTRVAKEPRVNLVSLQRNQGRDQLDGSGIQNILDLPETLDSEGAFLDSVAVMSELDLVITSDTAIAHVAGAIGIPVWIALQYMPDWRWGLSSEDSPWYPSAKLYRQRQRGNWQEVFERITSDLLSHPKMLS
jgi:Flp pilus assembly protein TadD